MEREIVLGAVAILTSLGGTWLLTRPTKKQLPPISSKAKTGYCYVGLFVIGIGLVNLYFGFRDGEMYWVSKGWGHRDAWLPYDGYKRAFAYLGFMYTGMVFFGLLIIRLYVFGRREEE
jgi:hypothetical protein